MVAGLAGHLGGLLGLLGVLEVGLLPHLPLLVEGEDGQGPLHPLDQARPVRRRLLKDYPVLPPFISLSALVRLWRNELKLSSPL